MKVESLRRIGPPDSLLPLKPRDSILDKTLLIKTLELFPGIGDRYRSIHFTLDGLSLYPRKYTLV